ncbi:MAG: YeeE/YedE thiosulfate transporter family protein [Longimicrobiales bacterium]
MKTIRRVDNRAAQEAPQARPPVRRAQPYTNPYLAGVGIGLVLLAAFVLVGRGLGASGAFSTTVATAVRAAAPAHGAGNAFYEAYAPTAQTSALPVPTLFQDWLFLEVIGITLGGLASAVIARRVSWRIERGSQITNRHRMTLAFGGGCIMGVGAKLARGCTSGLGLTGGALLSVGSWLFVLAAFAAAYAAAPLVRRAWR